MADDKKKDDKKAAAPSLDGQAIGVRIIWTLVIASFFFTFIFTKLYGTTGEVGQFPPAGTILIGKQIANNEEVSVRREPGGTIIGTQDKRLFGTVTAGPIEQYGARWWRVDYEEAPDGWVVEDEITATIWLFVIVNSIPYAIGYLQPIGAVLSVLMALVVLYIVIREKSLPNINDAEEKAFLAGMKTPPREVVFSAAPASEIPAKSPVVNERWMHIEDLINSHNVNDWKQAIIEADIILDEMLEKIGYPGMTIADKLKQVEPSDFNTLDFAWEAHKIRNRIAHDGSSYTLTKGDAERVIGLYRKVFNEFYFI